MLHVLLLDSLSGIIFWLLSNYITFVVFDVIHLRYRLHDVYLFFCLALVAILLWYCGSCLTTTLMYTLCDIFIYDSAFVIWMSVTGLCYVYFYICFRGPLSHCVVALSLYWYVGFSLEMKCKLYYLTYRYSHKAITQMVAPQ